MNQPPYYPPNPITNQGQNFQNQNFQEEDSTTTIKRKPNQPAQQPQQYDQQQQHQSYGSNQAYGNINPAEVNYNQPIPPVFGSPQQTQQNYLIPGATEQIPFNNNQNFNAYQYNPANNFNNNNAMGSNYGGANVQNFNNNNAMGSNYGGANIQNFNNNLLPNIGNAQMPLYGVPQNVIPGANIQPQISNNLDFTPPNIFNQQQPFRQNTQIAGNLGLQNPFNQQPAGQTYFYSNNQRIGYENALGNSYAFFGSQHSGQYANFTIQLQNFDQQYQDLKICYEIIGQAIDFSQFQGAFENKAIQITQEQLPIQGNVLEQLSFSLFFLQYDVYCSKWVALDNFLLISSFFRAGQQLNMFLKQIISKSGNKTVFSSIPLVIKSINYIYSTIEQNPENQWNPQLWDSISKIIDTFKSNYKALLEFNDSFNPQLKQLPEPVFKTLFEKHLFPEPEQHRGANKPNLIDGQFQSMMNILKFYYSDQANPNKYLIKLFEYIDVDRIPVNTMKQFAQENRDSRLIQAFWRQQEKIIETEKKLKELQKKYDDEVKNGKVKYIENLTNDNIPLLTSQQSQPQQPKPQQDSNFGRGGQQQQNQWNDQTIYQQRTYQNQPIQQPEKPAVQQSSSTNFNSQNNQQQIPNPGGKVPKPHISVQGNICKFDKADLITLDQCQHQFCKLCLACYVDKYGGSSITEDIGKISKTIACPECPTQGYGINVLQQLQDAYFSGFG